MIVQAIAGVKITGSPEQCHMIWAFDTEAKVSKLPITITCGEEGHAQDDPHTKRKAFDIRTKDRQPTEIRELYFALKALLGFKWTVLYEVPQKPNDILLADIAVVNPKATAPHIHVQVKIGHEYP